VELKETTYSPSSWEGTTRNIKQHFGWKTLTKDSASAIMKMYLSRVSIEDMIDKLKLEEF
jgi:hypothetical protein